MSTKLFILIVCMIFIIFLMCEESLYHHFVDCDYIDDDIEEPYLERKEELENNDPLDAVKTVKEIEGIVDVIRSPFYAPPTKDINTSLTNFQKTYGSKEKKAQVGNLRKAYQTTVRTVHQPLLQYYDSVNWFERDTDHDFDMFLK